MNDAAPDYIPRPGEYDPLADNQQNDHTGDQPLQSKPAEEGGRKFDPRKVIPLFTPSELKNYEPPKDESMVGDNHIQRGEIAVLAGPPGCGKSRAVLWLAVLGALGKGEWFGRKVNCQFKTLILQDENGRSRMHDDFKQIPDVEKLDGWLLVSDQLPKGMSLRHVDIRRALIAILKEFGPDLLVIDPWRNCVRDSTEKEYSEVLAYLREVLAAVPKRPAVLILHHIRKPKSEDKHSGRSLSFLLSGSDALHAAARAVFILQPATDDTDDARTIFTVTKNNNGHFGLRGAWTRHTWFFEEVPDFDWDEYDAGHAKTEPKVKEEHIRALFKDESWRPRSEAAKQLMQLTGCGRSAAYEALKWNGRFGKLLIEHPTQDDWIGLRQGDAGARAEGDDAPAQP